MAIKTQTIDSTAHLSDLGGGKIPVGIEGGVWKHVTPQDIADAVQVGLADAVTGTLKSEITEAVSGNLQEGVSQAVTEKTAAAKTELQQAVSENIQAGLQVLNRQFSALSQNIVENAVPNAVDAAMSGIQAGGGDGGYEIERVRDYDGGQLTIDIAAYDRPTVVRARNVGTLAVIDSREDGSTHTENKYEIIVELSCEHPLEIARGTQEVRIHITEMEANSCYLFSILNGHMFGTRTGNYQIH